MAVQIAVVKSAESFAWLADKFCNLMHINRLKAFLPSTPSPLKYLKQQNFAIIGSNLVKHICNYAGYAKAS